MTVCTSCGVRGHETVRISRTCTVCGSCRTLPFRLPRIVTLCGSTRFINDFERENKRLTLAGDIVLSCGVWGTDDVVGPVKERLDALHKRKIDISDAIHVINLGGYIGGSTTSEIAYAKKHGKQITWMEDPAIAHIGN